jgi:hypothetical protein
MTSSISCLCLPSSLLSLRRSAPRRSQRTWRSTTLTWSCAASNLELVRARLLPENTLPSSWTAAHMPCDAAAIGRLCEKCAPSTHSHCRVPSPSVSVLTARVVRRRRQVCHLRLVRAPVHARSHLRRVQLWHLSGMRHACVDRMRLCSLCHANASKQGRCVICGGMGVSDAYYCKECTILEKDVRSSAYAGLARALMSAKCPSQRDGCPKIVNIGSAKTDLFYERKKYGLTNQ